MSTIFRTSRLAAAALLLGACEHAGPSATSPQAAVEPERAAAVSSRASSRSAIADRLEAEYNSGARAFPQMSADPRDPLSPETMRMMVATADHLAKVHAGDAD